MRYRLTSDPAAIAPALAGGKVSTIIWTTTPWTLPASLAVAFHPDFEYVALARRRLSAATVYIVAAAALPQVAAACKLGPTKELARFKGAMLERVTFQHPFLERTILGVLATYVTADTGHRRSPHRSRPRRRRLLHRPALRPRPHLPRRCRRSHPRRSRRLARGPAARHSTA